MSIALMSQVWKLDMPSTRKMVLLALADNANDMGECFPSISMLSEKCSLCERAIQGHISTLQNDGFLSREIRAGRSTFYSINLNPTPASGAPQGRTSCTPADSAPLNIMHPTPAPDAPSPPHQMHPTPASGAPITIKEPSIEPLSNHQKKKSKSGTPGVVPLPEWLDPNVWSDFEESRQKIAPLTNPARKRIIIKLDGLRKKHDPNKLLGEAIERGWRTIFEPKDWKTNSPRNGDQPVPVRTGAKNVQELHAAGESA